MRQKGTEILKMLELIGRHAKNTLAYEQPAASNLFTKNAELIALRLIISKKLYTTFRINIDRNTTIKSDSPRFSQCRFEYFYDKS